MPMNELKMILESEPFIAILIIEQKMEIVYFFVKTVINNLSILYK